MRRLVTFIALVAGTLIPAAGGSDVPAEADSNQHTGLGVRLVDAPAATLDNPRGRVYIIDHVAPGTLLERRIEVVNRTGRDARIQVYAAAAAIKDGSFKGLDGETPNELSNWTTLGASKVALADGGRRMVDVKIDVPPDAAPGEQYAVVWAQTTSAAGDGSGITQVNRVGIRVYLSVGPGGEPASGLRIESLTSARDRSGNPLVRATIHNTGGRALDLSGALRLTEGPGGLSAGPFPVTLGTTLGIGQTEPIDIHLDKRLPNGPWKARVEVSSGLLTQTAQATITFPDAGTGETVTASDGIGHWWWAAAGGAVLGLALVWWLLARGRRRQNSEPGLRSRVPAVVGT